MIISEAVKKQADDALFIEEKETEFVEVWKDGFPEFQFEELQDICIGEYMESECFVIGSLKRKDFNNENTIRCNAKHLFTYNKFLCSSSR